MLNENEENEKKITLNQEKVTVEEKLIIDESEVVIEATTPNQKIDELHDGVQILRDQEEDSEPEEEILQDNDLKKLIQFTTGIKDVSQEDIDTLREDEVELERLIKLSMLKSKNFTYNPKKDFGDKYKRKRKIKNNMARASRRINR